MKREETTAIMRILETAYPQFYAKQGADTRKDALRLWHDMFADDNGFEVGAAVKAFIATDTKGFPPSIGQIKERLVQLRAPDMLDEAQAWGIVSRAIKRSAYHADEEFEKLPQIIQAVVSSPAMLKAWAMGDAETLQTVVASNFQRAYRARAYEAKERLALPAEIRQVLECREVMRELPARADPDELQRRAIALLAEQRERDAEVILGND